MAELLEYLRRIDSASRCEVLRERYILFYHISEDVRKDPIEYPELSDSLRERMDQISNLMGGMDYRTYSQADANRRMNEILSANPESAFWREDHLGNVVFVVRTRKERALNSELPYP